MKYSRKIQASVSDFRTGCNEIQFEYTLSGFVDGVLDKVFSNKESLDKTKRINVNFSQTGTLGAQN